MFGAFVLHNENYLIEKVEYELVDGASFKSANKNGLIIIDTPMGRVNLNKDTYFEGVPEIILNAKFEGELSPKQFLEKKVGKKITHEDVSEFQQLLIDLIDAEYRSKDDSE